jgi:hypothetical protein
MLRAIQSRAVRLHGIEEQDILGAIPAGVRNYRNQITRLERFLIPSLTDHEAGARGLDIPCSYRGRVCRVRPHCYDDVAVRVLPAILLYDASIGNVLAHIKHRARMMSEGGSSRG